MAKKKEKEEISEEENAILERQKVDKKQTRELYWIFGVMVGLIAIFILSSFIFQGVNSFEYRGLEFTKEMSGDLTFFHHYYFFERPSRVALTGGAITDPEIVQYNLYLRVDPRTNDVPVTGEIFPEAGKTMYVSVNGTGLLSCPYSSVAIANLASFLSGNLVPVKSATPDPATAEEGSFPLITCENVPSSEQAIIIQEGPESSIIRKTNNCYEVTASNCEILDVTEKFITQSIIDARARRSGF